MARHVRVAAALAAVASAALLAGCGGGSDGVFDREEFGFTFEYPTDFTESDDVKIDENLGSEAAASYGIGLDDDNVILVQRYDIEATVTDSNLDQVKWQRTNCFEVRVRDVHDPDRGCRAACADSRRRPCRDRVRR